MKRIYYVSIILVLLIVSFLGITYSFEYEQTDGNISFEIIGPKILYIGVNTEYEEYGIKVMQNGNDVTKDVKIDASDVDTNKLGEYKVKYEYNEEYVYRDVIVIDKIKPVISLIGGEEVYILLGGSYQEAGYTVNDNYDTDLNNKVKVTGSVNTKKEGEYELKYSVTDNSGNTGEVIRKVIVKKPVITVENNFGTRISPTSYNVTLYSNTIVKNAFYKYGIYYEGYVKNSANNYKIKLKNRDSKLEYSYNMNVMKNNYYSGNLNLTALSNGVYDLYIVSNKEERLLNKLDIFSKIVRAKVGNKLATVSYDSDYVTITIEDFKYQYDVTIDPGHGGSDIGAANGIMAEKNLNLKVSKYEKCRYESMGYKVYMIRYDDSNGEMLGNNSLDPLDRRALAIGYYGAVSRVVYSNHHNGSNDTSEHGFEIIVSNQITAKELTPELNIYKQFSDFYKIKNDRIRMYSKDYYTDQVFNKSNGEVYDKKNYYSVIRIPYEIYNVKNVIYEPIFMSNSNDFNWYYSSNNWIKISEMKIQEYVNYMGGEYNSDNKKCL